MPPPLHLPFLSSATITLWVLSSSSAHIPTPLACLLCVCGLCSVGLSADISISHMFISAATPTRFVPPPSLSSSRAVWHPGDILPRCALLLHAFPPPQLLVCGSALLKHVRLLAAVFCAFSLCTVDCSPPSPSLLCALPTTNHLTSFLLPDNPPPLAAFGGGSGAGQGIGWGRTP